MSNTNYVAEGQQAFKSLRQKVGLLGNYVNRATELRKLETHYGVELMQRHFIMGEFIKSDDDIGIQFEDFLDKFDGWIEDAGNVELQGFDMKDKIRIQRNDSDESMTVEMSVKELKLMYNAINESNNLVSYDPYVALKEKIYSILEEPELE